MAEEKEELQCSSSVNSYPNSNFPSTSTNGNRSQMGPHKGIARARKGFVKVSNLMRE
jgi:hypothetical protein